MKNFYAVIKAGGKYWKINTALSSDDKQYFTAMQFDDPACRFGRHRFYTRETAEQILDVIGAGVEHIPDLMALDYTGQSQFPLAVQLTTNSHDAEEAIKAIAEK